MSSDSIFEGIQRLKYEIFNGKAANIFIGEHKSPLGGSGYEVRDIELWERGDSFSSIDWALSLATWPDKIYKLDRVETKETPVAIVADCSPSMMLGFDPSGNKFKLLLHLIGVFSFTASYFQDSIAMALAGVDEDPYIPLRHGHGHIMNAIHSLIERADKFHEDNSEGKISNSSGLDLNEAIGLIGSMVRRQSTIVIISDFMDAISGKVPLDMEILEYLSGRHRGNVMAVFAQDDNEFAWDDVRGMVLVRNIESGRVDEVAAKQFRTFMKSFVQEREQIRKKLSDIGIESLVLSWDDYFSRLSDFVASRRAV